MTQPITDPIAVTPATRARNEAVDVLRGLVMVIMALDHARDFVMGGPGQGKNPTDLETTTYALFFTRWITHFCAPVFVLLAGTGAYLARGRRSTAELSRFLVTRGLWLVFLELTLVHFGFFLDVHYRFTLLQVIWAIGWSMVLMSALVWLPTGAVAGIGVAIIALHDLLDPIQAEGWWKLRWLWLMVHEPGRLHAGGEHIVYVAYPVLPWLGVMAAGYGLGWLVTVDADKRRRRVAALGLALTLAFVVLRWVNGYGDPHPYLLPWRGRAYELLSFLNCEKYPPSLDYLLMTLGPSLMLLAALDRPWARKLTPLLVFGRVPLFYYLAHTFVIHLVVFLFALPSLKDPMFRMHLQRTGVPGWELPMVYAVWAIAVLLLYWPCRWYARYKQRSSKWWVSYL